MALQSINNIEHRPNPNLVGFMPTRKNISYGYIDMSQSVKEKQGPKKDKVLAGIGSTLGALSVLAYCMKRQKIKNPLKVEYTVKEMLKLWEDKVDLINEKVIPSIKIGDYRYEEIMTSIIFAMGLAENAMQYLAELELDLGNKINNLTLAHKILYTLSSLLSIFFLDIFYLNTLLSNFYFFFLLFLLCNFYFWIHFV